MNVINNIECAFICEGLRKKMKKLFGCITEQTLLAL